MISKSAANAVFPQQASDYFEVDSRRDIRVRARIQGASTSRARQAEDYLIYQDALGVGNHIIYRATIDGLEDYVSFDQRPPRAMVEYEIELDKSIGALRLVSNTLEFLNEDGYPLMRVAPPSLVDAAGETHDAMLALSGWMVVNA